MEINNLYIDYGFDQLPLRVSNYEIPCYILSNQQHVFSISGIQKIFHYEGKSDFWLANILNKTTLIPSHIQNAYENPIIAYVSSENTSRTVKVIDAGLFIETCRLIAKMEHLDAKDDLNKIYKRAMAFYKIIENENIAELIKEISGYLFQKECVKNLLAEFLQEKLSDPAYLWVKTFPNSFYDRLFEIHELDWKSARQDIQILAKIIYDVIFCRISNELRAELQTQQPKRNYVRKGKQPRDIENKNLKNYIDSVFSLLETSANSLYMFLLLLDRIHPLNIGYQATYPFKVSPSKTKPTHSIFSPSLKRVP